MNPLSTYPQRQRKYSGELCSTFWHLEFETLSKCVSQRWKLNRGLLWRFQEHITVFQDFKHLIYSKQTLTLRSRISKRKNSLNKIHYVYIPPPATATVFELKTNSCSNKYNLKGKNSITHIDLR